MTSDKCQEKEISFNESVSHSLEGDFNGMFQHICTQFGIVK